MNIGQTVKLIQKEYPSVTISRLRFLEKRASSIHQGRKVERGIIAKKILIEF